MIEKTTYKSQYEGGDEDIDLHVLHLLLLLFKYPPCFLVKGGSAPAFYTRIRVTAYRIGVITLAVLTVSCFSGLAVSAEPERSSTHVSIYRLNSYLDRSRTNYCATLRCLVGSVENTLTSDRLSADSLRPAEQSLQKLYGWLEDNAYGAVTAQAFPLPSDAEPAWAAFGAELADMASELKSIAELYKILDTGTGEMLSEAWQQADESLGGKTYASVISSSVRRLKRILDLIEDLNRPKDRLGGARTGASSTETLKTIASEKDLWGKAYVDTQSVIGIGAKLRRVAYAYTSSRLVPGREQLDLGWFSASQRFWSSRGQDLRVRGIPTQDWMKIYVQSEGTEQGMAHYRIRVTLPEIGLSETGHNSLTLRGRVGHPSGTEFAGCHLYVTVEAETLPPGGDHVWLIILLNPRENEVRSASRPSSSRKDRQGLYLCRLGYAIQDTATLRTNELDLLASAVRSSAGTNRIELTTEMPANIKVGDVIPIRGKVTSWLLASIKSLWLGVDIREVGETAKSTLHGKTVECTKTARPSREAGGRYGRLVFTNQGQRLVPGETRTFEATYTFDKDIWENPYKPGKYILKYAAWEGNPGDGIMLSEMQTHEFELKPSPTAERIRELIEEIEKKEEEAAPLLEEEERLSKLKEREEQELQRQIAEALINKNQASEEKAREEIKRSMAQMTNRLFDLLREKERISSESFSSTSLRVSIWTVPRSLSIWKAGLQGKGFSIYYCCNQDADVEIRSAVEISSFSTSGQQQPFERRLLSRRVQAGRTYQLRTRLSPELIELVQEMERARKSVNMPLPRVRGKAEYSIRARIGGKEALGNTCVTLTE